MVDTWLGSLNSKTITLSHSTEYILMALSVLVASFGIFIAYKKYARFDLEKPELEVGFVGRKLYVDEDFISLGSIFMNETNRCWQKTELQKVTSIGISKSYLLSTIQGREDTNLSERILRGHEKVILNQYSVLAGMNLFGN